jgi:hypothetical protein
VRLTHQSNPFDGPERLKFGRYCFLKKAVTKIKKAVTRKIKRVTAYAGDKPWLCEFVTDLFRKRQPAALTRWLRQKEKTQIATYDLGLGCC